MKLLVFLFAGWILATFALVWAFALFVRARERRRREQRMAHELLHSAAGDQEPEAERRIA